MRIRDGDVVAGEREHLRDAVAHQAGADDGDARFASSISPPCSRRRRRGCGRCRSPTPSRRGTAAARRDRTARRGGPSARASRKPARTVLPRSSSANIHSVSGERKTVGPSALTVMPVAAPFAAERLGDAVDRRLRRAIGGVAGRMAEQPARRRHQDDLAALALLEHLPAGGARHQPGLRDVGVHHVEEIVGLLIDDLRDLVLAGGDHQDVDAAEAVDRRVDDGGAVLLRVRPLGDDRRPCRAERLAFGRDLLQRRRRCWRRSRHWRRRRPAPWPRARRTRRSRR